MEGNFMNYAVYNIALDIHKTGSQVALPMIRGENKRKIVISLTENGRPYKIASGCTAKFAAFKPDGKPIYNDCVVDIENNLIIYTITSQTTAVMGEVKCQIELIGTDDGLLFSPTFSLIVADKLYNQEPILASSEEFNALTAYVADLQKKLDNGEFKGDKGDKGDRGDRGPQGVQGDTGPAGKDADSSSLSPSIICTEKGTAITISDSSESGFEAFSIYGRSTQNGTPTPSAPVNIASVGDDGKIIAGVQDKTNIFDTVFTSGGITQDTGKEFVDTTLQRTDYISVKEGSIYKISGLGGPVRIFCYNANKVFLSSIYGTTGEWFVVPTSCAFIRFHIVIANYNKDLKVNRINAITLENRVLRAIPVTDSSLATYTDTNGQMWCADEIDFERGVYIQRCYTETISMTYEEANNRYIGEISKNANSKISNSIGIIVLTDKLPYNENAGKIDEAVNGVRVSYGNKKAVIAYFNDEVISSLNILYPLEISIETPLTSEQIAAYKALKTNYPSTTILNDENAFMKVGYRADTKKFIEKMSGSTTQISSVTLAASKWVGTASPYSQVVTVPGATKNSKIDLNPSVAQLGIFHNKDISFVVENDDGVITVYCIGQKPTNDYTIQATITEVYVNG